MRIVVSPQYGGVNIYAEMGKKTFAVEYSLEELRSSDVIGLLKNIAHAGCLEEIVFHLLFGGDYFKAPAAITPQFLKKFDRLTPLFPFYIPHAKEAMRIFCRNYPETPALAFFETSFFMKLPSVSKFYAIPRDYHVNNRIKKFGFHGIIHEANSKLFKKGKKVVSIVFDLHTTVSAVHNGKPLMISLGYTPLEGIMTRTSCGDLDPGIVFYLMNQYDYSLFQIDEILKRKSGFVGISGYDFSMEEFAKLYSKSERVKLAFDVYENQILKYIGESIAVLGDIDEIVFSGPKIGTYSQIIHNLLKKISFLGLQVNVLPWNTHNELTRITSSDSRIGVWLNRRSVEEILLDLAQRRKEPGKTRAVGITIERQKASTRFTR